MYVGEKPWHGLGEYVGENNVTSAIAIEKAGINWEVKKEETFYNWNGTQKRGLGFDVVRQDNGKTLGHVGDVYNPLQNKEAFKFMDDIIGAGRAVYHTAGSLKGGSKIWLMVDMKEQAEISKGDDIRNFILLSNAHDGTAMVDICLTTVRVVCNNTLQIALTGREKGSFTRFRHTGKMGEKIANVTDTLKLCSDKFSKFIEAGKLLQSEQITAKELDDFLVRLELERANQNEADMEEKIKAFKRTTKYAELVGAFESSPGSKLAGSTLWGAVNAVTYHIDHMASSRLTDSFSSVEEARLTSAWFNAGADKKDRAFSLALEFASKK